MRHSFRRHTGTVLAAVVCAALCAAAQEYDDFGEAFEYEEPAPAPTGPAEEPMLQPRRLVDAHTAGILPRAHFDFEFRVYPSAFPGVNGAGLMLGIAVGITDRLNIGLSYGGDGIVGRGTARANPYPGGMIKYRLIEERVVMPAIAIGYEHQGYGGIEAREGLDGFVYKSPGFFVALSKNFLLFRRVNLGFHGTANFSLEEVDEVSWPNAVLGLDVGLNEELAVAFEYDLGLTYRDPVTDWDPTRQYYANPLCGLLNVGLRWAFARTFYIEALAKDVLENRYDERTDRPLGWSRELKLVYVNHF